MLRKLFLISLLAIKACIIISACNSRNTKNLELSFNPEQNKSFQFSLIRTSNTRYWERLSFDTLKLEGRFKLEKHEDSLVRMRFVFSRFQLKSNTGRSVWIDSLPDGSKRRTYFNATEERDKLLALLPGMSISVILSNKGEVQEVEELNRITDSLSAIAQVEASNVRRTLRDYLSGDGFKDIFNSLLYILPGKQVVTSDRWTNDFLLTIKAPVKVSSLYTLEAENNDTATIRIQALLSATQGEDGRVYMKGKQDGYATVSRKNGLPFYRETIAETVTTRKKL